MILAIDHVQITIPIGAEQEAREFYCGLLGLKEIAKPEPLAGRGGFWLEAGDRQVHVGTEDGVERRNTKVHVAYIVDDIGEMRRILAENDVDVIEGIPIPGCRRFEFRDPFGNRVEFLQKESDDNSDR